MSDKYECEGSCDWEGCDGHFGEAVKVIVSGYGWEPQEFYYCQTAIEEDKRRGFDVEIVTQTTENQ